MSQTAAQARDPKRHFLEETFLSLSIRDAFVTRAGGPVYKSKDDDHSLVQNAVFSALREFGSHYKSPVHEETHIQNISYLGSRVSDAGGHLLTGGYLVFGVAQKLLNSWLKYLWCDQRIVEPPHCPFDRNIIDKLTLPSGIGRQWTRADEADYRAWVSAAKDLAGKTGESLAEWELREWAG
jgi:hypothetical protein